MKRLDEFTLGELLSTRVIDIFKDCKNVKELNETEETFLKLFDSMYAERLECIRHTIEQLEKELKEATQCAKYVEEEIKLTGNEDLYKHAQEFHSYANEVRERLNYIKGIE